MRIGSLALVVMFLAAVAQAKLHTEAVEYKVGDGTFEGYLAYDDAVTGKRPGVLVVHEWMGLGPHAQKRADQLAGMGYMAFAADMYGKGVRPKDQKEAGAMAGKLKGDRQLMRQRANASLDVLRKNDRVDPKRLAAIGYCFGGTCVLELARGGADVAGVVSFHGALDTPTPADARSIKCKVLVLHGGDDPFVPAKDVTAFMDEMRSARVDWQLNVYGGAVHSFTNPDAGSDPAKGAAYNADADRRSWEAMKLLFAEIFR